MEIDKLFLAACQQEGSYKQDVIKRPADSPVAENAFLRYLQPELLLTLQPFYHQQYADIDKRVFAVCGKNEVELRYHARYIVPCLADALRTEDNPADDDQQKSGAHPARFLYRGEQASLRRHIRVSAVLAHNEQWQEQHGMIGSPADERPVGAVPEAADKEYNQRVAHRLPLAAPASAQRDVDVVAEPGGERYVPAAPELGDVSREIGEIEVAHQVDAEQARRADGDVRISREIAVYLEGEEERTHKQVRAAQCLIVVEDDVDGGGAVVRHHHFLEQSPQYLPHSVCRLAVVEAAWCEELRQQVGGTLDGTRHQLGEEADEGEESHRIVRGLQFMPVHINRVAQCLEGVETDAHRQQYVYRHPIRFHAEETEQLGEVLPEEVEILEDAEDEQVEDDVCGTDPLLPGALPFQPFQKQAAGKAAERGECYEEKETPVPPTVEGVACRHYKQVLPTQRLEHEPIEHECYRQKYQELKRIEQHVTCNWMTDGVG